MRYEFGQRAEQACGSDGRTDIVLCHLVHHHRQPADSCRRRNPGGAERICNDIRLGGRMSADGTLGGCADHLDPRYGDQCVLHIYRRDEHGVRLAGGTCHLARLGTHLLRTGGNARGQSSGRCCAEIAKIRSDGGHRVVPRGDWTGKGGTDPCRRELDPRARRSAKSVCAARTPRSRVEPAVLSAAGEGRFFHHHPHCDGHRQCVRPRPREYD